MTRPSSAPEPPAGLIAVGPREWMNVWVRVIASPSVKLVGTMAAHFADYEDGTKIHPGTELLAAVTGLTTRTVKESLKQMREWEVIWRYVEGSKQGRRKLSDEYRLTIPKDIIGRIPMLDPEYQMPVDNHP